MGGRMGARRSGGLRQQRCRGEGGGILLIPSLFSLLAPAAAGRGHLLCPPHTHAVPIGCWQGCCPHSDGGWGSSAMISPHSQGLPPLLQHLPGF